MSRLGLGQVRNSKPFNIAGQSSWLVRRSHNPKVVGSNPSPATNKALSSNGQDIALSRQKQEFNSPKGYQYTSVVELADTLVLEANAEQA